MKGYVYVISNRAMPGIYKIGFTLKDPALRAKELESTGIPHPFTVEYEILVDAPHMLEKKVHQTLSLFNENKEWFRCDVSACIAAIKNCHEGDIYYERCAREENFLALEKEKQKKHAAEQAQEIETAKNREMEKIKAKYTEMEKEYIRTYFIKSLCILLALSISTVFFLFYPEHEIPLDILSLFIVLPTIASLALVYFDREKIKDHFWRKNNTAFQKEIEQIKSMQKL